MGPLQRLGRWIDRKLDRRAVSGSSEWVCGDDAGRPVDPGHTVSDDRGLRLPTHGPVRDGWWELCVRHQGMGADGNPLCHIPVPQVDGTWRHLTVDELRTARPDCIVRETHPPGGLRRVFVRMR